MTNTSHLKTSVNGQLVLVVSTLIDLAHLGIIRKRHRRRRGRRRMGLHYGLRCPVLSLNMIPEVDAMPNATERRSWAAVLNFCAFLSNTKEY